MRSILIIPSAILLSSLLYILVDGQITTPPACPKKNDLTFSYYSIPDARTNIFIPLWNSATPILTRRAAEYKTAVLNLINHNYLEFNIIGAISSVLIWMPLPFYRCQPSLCLYEKVIKLENIPKIDPAYCPALKDMMTSAVQTFTEYGTYIKATILQNSGCPFTKPTITKNTCPVCRSKRDASKIWAAKGNQYPCSIQQSSLSALNSGRYMDQLIGMISTATLNEPFRELIYSSNIEAVFELIQMQLMGPIDVLCCTSLEADIKESVDNFIASITSSSTSIIASNGC